MLLAPLWPGPRSSAVIGLSPSAVPTAQWPQTRVSCSCALAVTSHPPSARIHPPGLPFFPGPPSHRSRPPPAFRTAHTCSTRPFFLEFSHLCPYETPTYNLYLQSAPTICSTCALSLATSCASVPSDPPWCTRVTSPRDRRPERPA